MVLKCGRREFIVGEKDLILDNGACYQLITQTYYQDWSHVYPLVSKATFNKLLKAGVIRLSDKKYKPFLEDDDNKYKLYEFIGDQLPIE